MAKSDLIYSQAVDKYLAGDVVTASKLCQKALAKDQKDDRVLNLLGLVQQSFGNEEQARVFFEKAIRVNPRNIEAMTNLANTYQLKKEYSKALDIYRQIIKVKPDFAKAYYNAALALAELGDNTGAEELYVKSISLDDSFVDNYINLANLYKKDGDLDRACDVLEDGQRVSNSPRLDLSLSLVLSEQKKHNRAIELAVLAVSKDKTPQALNDLGIIFYTARQYGEAIKCYLEALTLKPDFADCLSNLANAFLDKGDEHLAKGALLKAISLEPNKSEHYVNYGVYAKKSCDLTGAKEAFLTALRLNTNSSAAATNLGILYMYEGNFRDGLPLYEKRKKPFIKCNKPLCNGEHLRGKTLFVYHEQGFGDTINFARLLNHPKLYETKVLFFPQKELATLFDEELLGVRLVSADDVFGGALEFDFHLPLLSLLYFLEISPDNMPESIDFTVKNQDKVDYFKSKLSSVKGKKIGIAWQGNKEYSGDKERSVSLSLFEPFLAKGYTLVAINKEFDTQELERFAMGKEVFEFSKDLNSFSDTAALLDCLEYVVSIDTSVAHLAASKNINTHILLPKISDWRWGIESKSSYMYKSATLYRQDIRGDWNGVIEKVVNNF